MSMFVCWEDFQDWHEEQTILEFENEFTHTLDFEGWEEELLSPQVNTHWGASCLSEKVT
jgi:hypothetical protein